MRAPIALFALAAAVAPVAAVAAPARDHHGNALTEDGQFAHANRLFFSTSPYLLQHAHQPVEWMEWGEEAFAKAREEGKPIFLSIGYSTCHWCHVMARESFSDETVAAVLNAHFVPVKVDREQRPDVDEIYMSAVQLMQGRGGWPLSVWLTPEREPFFGGTYFPKRQFLQLLEQVAARWRAEPAVLRAEASRTARRVRARLDAARVVDELSESALDGAVDALARSFDDEHGGWRVPKFPNENVLLYLLDRWQRDRRPEALRMATTTLDAMRRGGIHDQVGGGFSRYALDARWTVPHFEKMLYNQAWLGRCYAQAYRLTGDAAHRRAAEGIARYVLRDMTSPGGAFYSAEDADSEGEEGKFYVWRPAEVVAALGAEGGALANAYFGIGERGNFADHPGASIPTARHAPAAFAAARGLTEAQLLAKLDSIGERLLEVRDRRVRPERDDKVLADWNGFMIGTLALAGRLLDEPHLVAAAERAATFVLRELRDDRGRLLHQWRDGRAEGPAFLDDHAALADGLIELHEATLESHWLEHAERLHAAARTQFRDADGAFARTGPRHERLLATIKDGTDGAVPSGNGLTAWNAVRLWRLTGDESYRDDAVGVLRAFGRWLHAPSASAFLLRAFEALEHGALGGIDRDPDGVLRLSVQSDEPLHVSAGGRVELALELHVRSGWHVNAARDVPAPLKPTSLAALGPFALDATRIPDGDARRLAFVAEPVPLLSGTQALSASLRAAADHPPGPGVAHVVVTTQACDDARCLRPRELRVEVPILVGPADP